MRDYLKVEASLNRIGIASNPDKRYRALQLLSPTTLILLFTVAGTITNERELHERFKDRRRHGEWFALTEADIQLIMGDGDA